MAPLLFGDELGAVGLIVQLEVCLGLLLQLYVLCDALGLVQLLGLLLLLAFYRAHPFILLFLQSHLLESVFLGNIRLNIANVIVLIIPSLLDFRGIQVFLLLQKLVFLSF